MLAPQENISPNSVYLNQILIPVVFFYGRLHNEDGSVKTPSMELIWNVFDKRLELSQPQPHPHPQFYFIPAAHTQTQQPPQRKSSSLKLASETQSQKAFRNRWLSCFCFPFQRN